MPEKKTKKNGVSKKKRMFFFVLFYFHDTNLPSHLFFTQQSLFKKGIVCILFVFENLEQNKHCLFILHHLFIVYWNC